MESLIKLNNFIPVFIILLVAESVIAAYERKDWFERKDTFTSLAMGIGNVITNFGAKLLVLGGFGLVYHFRLFTLPMDKVWVWVMAFFAEDFTYYWYHRTSHNVRWFWASHVIHHSSEKYNLSTALRQTWTGTISGSFLFWLWMPLVGFNPVMVVTLQVTSLLYQFWIHTEWIGKLAGPIEWIMNTPSHHRVHHGSDLKYLDKNHAGVLIIWDRLFGTFQEEEEHPRYGLVTNLNTHNPFAVAFSEWIALVRDIAHSGSIRNAWNYAFGPPGWSHDGSRKTTKELRAEQAKGE